MQTPRHISLLSLLRSLPDIPDDFPDIDQGLLPLKVDGKKLFKFSESLQQRMETLLENKKADQLSAEEVEELDTIGEIDRIFTHINAMMAVQDVDR